jgi:hypothetical protein
VGEMSIENNQALIATGVFMLLGVILLVPLLIVLFYWFNVYVSAGVMITYLGIAGLMIVCGIVGVHYESED